MLSVKPEMFWIKGIDQGIESAAVVFLLIIILTGPSQ
jgi:hypothetical protein